MPKQTEAGQKLPKLAMSDVASVPFVMAINPEELRQASQKGSLAGIACQFSGAMLAVFGCGLTAATVLGGGGLYGLLLGGSATFALALAGAPIAALGSIANSQKASKEMLLLYVKDSIDKTPPRRIAPPPPPPLPRA
jgi:hypothetical protein